MKLYISIGTRVADPADPDKGRGGYIVIDYATKTVEKTIPVVSEKLLGKGRSGGTSGICLHNSDLYIATRDAIHIFAIETNKRKKCLDLQKYFRYDGRGGIHQIKSRDDLLYVCYTSSDLLLTIKDDKVISERYLSGKPQNLLHFNSIGWDYNNNEYHLYCNPSRIYNSTQETDLVTQAGNLAHDICFLDNNTVIYSSSQDGAVFLFHIPSSKAEVIFKKPNAFVRGIACNTDLHSIFVATSPGMLVELDSWDFRIKQTFDFKDKTRQLITADQESCPFDLCILE